MALSLNNQPELTRIRPFFGAHIYSAVTVQRGKPPPDLSLSAARQLQRDPQQCAVIEDSGNGVKAGLDAGIEVWDLPAAAMPVSRPARLAAAHKEFHDVASNSAQAPGIYR